MENKLLPKWMAKTLGFLLIIFMVLLIINKIDEINGVHQTLQISATGKVQATPDIATMTVGVISQGANPMEVKDKNNQKINQVIAFIKQQGIDEKDIQTTGFYAYPQYNYANGQNTISGYQANQAVTIKVRNIDKSQEPLEKILGGVINNGANEIQGINFSMTDPDKLQQQARQQAIEKAKEKAKQLTSDANLRLGKIVNVIESSNDNIAPMPFAAANLVRMKSVAPNIELGNQEITETVGVIFEVY
jgi:uncharacterized protein YggE